MAEDRRSPHSEEGLLRALGLFDTAALVIGTVIGSGIFLVPAEIARAVHTAPLMLAVWAIGGGLTLLGALSLAELGAAMPHAGGIYTYIARAFGPMLGFLCGWMLFTRRDVRLDRHARRGPADLPRRLRAALAGRRASSPPSPRSSFSPRSTSSASRAARSSRTS